MLYELLNEIKYLAHKMAVQAHFNPLIESVISGQENPLAKFKGDYQRIDRKPPRRGPKYHRD